MKIGIITHYFNSKNYGGNFQAYALCRVLNELGYNAEQISFDRKDKSLKSTIKRTIKRFLHPNLCNRKSFKAREKAFKGFNQGLIPHSRVYDDKSISLCANDYDVLITGSDQVWHPHAVCDAYLLSFAPSSKTKLSYAASVAHNALTDAQKSRYQKALCDYKAISVRESEGKELIAPLAPCNVEVTLDPTLLLSKEQWLEVAEEYSIEEKYLFCYFLGCSVEQRRLATDYARKNNLKIVTLPNLLGKNRDCDKRFGDYKLYDVSPQKLLSIINGAECVFTDSFHATVFSLIFEKEHFVFHRDGKKSMSSRITTLTTLFGTQSHFCDTEDKSTLEYIENVQKVDYSQRFTEYIDLKNKSLDFLKNNL